MIGDPPHRAFAYLLDQLKGQGIDEAVILIGYMADTVREYYAGESYSGLKIRFVESPVEAETGQRLMDAAQRRRRRVASV